MREALVEVWQNVPDAELDRLFSTYLWRIKRWTRGLSAPTFAVRHIDSFKGLTPKSASTPAARYHLAAQTAVPMLAAWAEHPDETDQWSTEPAFKLTRPWLQAGHSSKWLRSCWGNYRRLRNEGFDELFGDEGKEKAWGNFASTDDDFRELPSRARYRYVSELYLASLLYYTNRFGDAEIRESRHRLFKWAYHLRTRHQRLQLVTREQLRPFVGRQPIRFCSASKCGDRHRTSAATRRGPRAR